MHVGVHLWRLCTASHIPCLTGVRQTYETLTCGQATWGRRVLNCLAAEGLAGRRAANAELGQALHTSSGPSIAEQAFVTSSMAGGNVNTYCEWFAV
jgi:hypothetical protein